ncbi:MAG: GPP34 family phosphoprotein [Bacteroidales bacterium]
MNLNLIESFLLLALDSEKGKFLTDSLAINHGLAGATLMKLAITNKIEVKDRRVYVIDNSSTEVDYIDQMLEYIQSSRKNRKVKYWVNRLASKWRGMRVDLLNNLIDRGILTRQKKRFIGLFTYSIYPSADLTPKQELLKKLRDIIDGQEKIDAKSLMLFSLLEATKLTRVLFSSRAEYKNGKKKIDELTKDFDMNPLIHITIKDVCSVVITASTSAAVKASIHKESV